MRYRPPMDEAPPAPVLLMASWRLPRMRSMPRAFLIARRLDRDGRAAPGCARMHRWVSRRSLLLTGWWRSRADAEAWLASPRFRDADARLRAVHGARAEVELRGGAEA